MTKKVLIVSHEKDGSAKLIMQRLDEIGQPHHLVDLGSYPNSMQGAISISNCPSGNMVMRTANYSFTSNDVKSIWWRRPRGQVRPPVIGSANKYTELESEIFTNSFFSLLDRGVLWVSDPEKTRIANHKPLQLKKAVEIGFQIPNTLITNDPQEVCSFLESNPGMAIIMKPIGTSYVRISEDPDDPRNENLSIFTKVINRDQILKNIDRVKNCPVIFQECAQQEFDIRITVVGDTVFAIKIGHSEDLGAGENNVDWRHQKLKRTYEKHELPEEIAAMCIRLTKELGLTFGAIDMAYTPGRGYFFFEINPQGQWVPSETVAGHPISLTFAKFLAEC
jgi:glutathione synthase/RimK-type ligase-like ATP-grasp enzyme